MAADGIWDALRTETEALEEMLVRFVEDGCPADEAEALDGLEAELMERYSGALIEAACDAEEEFTPDELEAFAKARAERGKG